MSLAPAVYPVIDDGAGRSLGPKRYAISARPSARYLHLPRSVYRHPTHQTMVALCGVMIHDPLWTDGPSSAYFPECGTCVGRAIGLTDTDVAYRPRGIRWLPKRWCPGPRHGLVHDLATYRASGLCLFCGQKVGWWGASWRQHEHGGTGIACRRHGWRSLTRSGDQVDCHAFEPFTYRCGEPAIRFWVIGAPS